MTDIDYLTFVRGTLDANLKAVLKLKTFQRPKGVESRLRDLIRETDSRLFMLSGGVD